ncbi:MAG: electron transfer flavoprotein subunit beta/FixA family protein [Bacteroidia bacterium]
MKLLVCISQVPDTTTKIRFTDNDTKFNEDKVTYIVNPYDEWYALVRALELKETLGGTVTIITVGTASVEPIIRKALAIGADDAVRIDMDPKDAYSTAKAIADYSADIGFDIVLTGKETIDYNGSEVGGMLAALLDLPFISLATSLNVNGDQAVMEIDIENGTEVITCKMPLVLSAAKGMAEARIPNMRGIMAARTKPITVVAAQGESLVEVDKFALPPAKSAVKLIDPDNMDQLVELLHSEAKVI